MAIRNGVEISMHGLVSTNLFQELQDKRCSIGYTPTTLARSTGLLNPSELLTQEVGS